MASSGGPPITLELGIAASRDEAVFGSGRPDGRLRREAVLRAIAAGYPTTTGFIDDLAQVQRPDGTHGPWHPGLDADAIHRERTRLRDAAFTLIAGLSMMRDSEIHEIARNSVVEHYGYPAGGTGGDHIQSGPVAGGVDVCDEVVDHDSAVYCSVGIVGVNWGEDPIRMDRQLFSDGDGLGHRFGDPPGFPRQRGVVFVLGGGDDQFVVLAGLAWGEAVTVGDAGVPPGHICFAKRWRC